MKTNYFSRRCLLAALLLLINYAANAQNPVLQEYFNEVGEYATIYRGEIESGYNALQFEKQPYYKSENFFTGSIRYKGKDYFNQQIRWDTYKDNLIIQSSKGLGIILDPERLEEAQLYQWKIIYYTPSERIKLGKGYYLLLHNGEKIKCLGKETHTLIKMDSQRANRFSRQARYYLIYDNNHYTVKNKSSFAKLFPQYKKQINTFAKEKKLNFRKNTEESLALLASYCENLLNTPSPL